MGKTYSYTYVQDIFKYSFFNITELVDFVIEHRPDLSNYGWMGVRDLSRNYFTTEYHESTCEFLFTDPSGAVTVPSWRIYVGHPMPHAGPPGMNVLTPAMATAQAQQPAATEQHMLDVLNKMQGFIPPTSAWSPKFPKINCLCCGKNITFKRTDITWADNFVLLSECCGKQEYLHISKEAMEMGKVPEMWTAFLTGGGDPKIV